MLLKCVVFCNNEDDVSDDLLDDFIEEAKKEYEIEEEYKFMYSNYIKY